MTDRRSERNDKGRAIMIDPNHMAQARRIESAFAAPAGRFVIRHATRVDARGVAEESWAYVADGVIEAVGIGDAECDAYVSGFGGMEGVETVDASGLLLTPGYVDIHAHGGWGCSFDDGPEAISVARACHMVHGTTRQVLSLITNPLDVMAANLVSVRAVMPDRPDVLGSHLEGPFLALSRKGAHDSACLVDPTPERVDQLLEAADGSLRQITMAPERQCAMKAVQRLAATGVVPAVGHCNADYGMAQRAFDCGARLLTHMFNAMNGVGHRDPGPIPAAVEDPRVTLELICDGFHVADPVLNLALNLAPHRIAFVTDAMAATGCPDGPYQLGALDVTVVDGHARLVSNGAIAGSTLTLEESVRRAVQCLGMGLPDAVEAATLTPARALELNRPNPITGAPLGLVAPGYAADLLLTDPGTLAVRRVWCAGRMMV